MNVYLKYGVNFLKFGKLVFKTCSHSVSIKTSEVMKACRTKCHAVHETKHNLHWALWNIKRRCLTQLKIVIHSWNYFQEEKNRCCLT